MSSAGDVVLTRDQVRRVDEIAISHFGLVGLVLMENAGRNAAEWLRLLGISGPVLIVCGKGNNAGDGFVIARHLLNHSVDVRLWLWFPPETLSHDAAVNFQILVRAGVPFSRIESPANLPAGWSRDLVECEWIVDALLGTGTQGMIREPFLTAIAQINLAGKKVFAVDLPSGLDCDTGQPLGTCVRATHTATFVAKKPGMLTATGATLCGDIQVIDIGVPRGIIVEAQKGEAAGT